jgi:hypothetical protein
MATEQELRQLFYGAQAMPDGPAKFQALDTAIRHAAAAGQEKLAFEFRHVAIESFVFGGDDRRAFLAFSQNLAAYDRSLDVLGGGSEHRMLWQYKWIVNSLPQFPEVPLQRTYSVLDDMQRRYLRGGHSLHAVHEARWKIAMHVGDLAQAEKSYHDMVTSKRDSLSDCRTCVPSAQAWYLNRLGKYEEAITAAEPAKRGGCRQQPQWIQSYLMLSYLHTGRLSDAAEMHRNSYRRMRFDHTYIGGIGSHLTFLALSGNEARGLELVEKHLPWLELSPSPSEALDFAAPAVLVLDRLADNGFGGLAVRGRLAEPGRPRPQVTVHELRAELSAYVEALAAGFDARNGTSYQSELARERMTAAPVVRRLALSVLDPGGTRKTEKVLALQERIVERTQAGDLEGAALARLAAAEAMRNGPNKEDAYAAAEEALLAVERLGLGDDVWRAKHLLWDLYRGDHRHREAALALLDELLEASVLPQGLPPKASLAEEGAKTIWGEGRAARFLAAAELYKERGDSPGELRTLEQAIAASHFASDSDAHALIERADRLAHGVGERASLDMTVAFVWNRLGREADALARAEAAQQGFAATDSAAEYEAATTFLCNLLLRMGRATEAERQARSLIAATEAQNPRRYYALLAQALRAQGREPEAEAIIAEHELQAWEIEPDEDEDD